MATIKQIRRRIRSVKTTQQITKAMEMVAAAKLRRAQERILLAASLRGQDDRGPASSSPRAAGEVSDPLFEVRPVRRRALVVIASDKGLCGSFNTNVFRPRSGSRGGSTATTIDLVPVGRRANEYFGKRGWNGGYRVPELGDQVDLDEGGAARAGSDRPVPARRDRSVEFLYTRFITTGTRRIVQETFLPVAAATTAAQARPRDYIYEPDAAAIFRPCCRATWRPASRRPSPSRWRASTRAHDLDGGGDEERGRDDLGI